MPDAAFGFLLQSFQPARQCGLCRGIHQPLDPLWWYREDHASFHAAYRDAFPDVKIEIEDMVAEGDKVAFRWSATATHRGNGLKFAATNKPVRFAGMGIIRVENGKLAEGWNIFDQLGMLQQLGVVTLPA